MRGPGVEQDPDGMDFMGHAPFALKKGKIKEKWNKTGNGGKKMEQNVVWKCVI